ncbi:MAG TPA: YqaA family protein [Woeseiaceae bacterium]|jgi:membrane protein YqaA with SNARE-associated domain
MRLFDPLYQRVLAWSAHRHAERYLAALSFAESSFFPIPPDVMLVPMCLADRHKAWRFAAVTTLTSVLGGIAGYAIGYFFIDMIEPWLHSSGKHDTYLRVREWFAVWGVWAVFVAGFSPIPYKIFTIAAGATLLSLPGFVIASAIGRGARFFLVAGLIVAGGERMADGLQRHVERLGWVVVAVAIAIGAYFMLRQ